MASFHSRLRHACRIMAGIYPLPEEVEEFLIMTILARLAAVEAAIAALQQTGDSSGALAAVQSSVDGLKSEVDALSNEVGTINAEIGSEPAPADPAPAADPSAQADPNAVDPNAPAA